MARPKKFQTFKDSVTTPDIINTENTPAEEATTNIIIDTITDLKTDSNIIKDKVIEKEVVTVKEEVPTPVIPVVENIKESTKEIVEENLPITPESDKHEMDRYIRVIYNRETASRISNAVTHQRDLNLWGVHQYNDTSRNSYSRSFYFKERSNAALALSHAQKYLAENM